MKDKSGREIRDVARERLKKLEKTSPDARQIRTRQEYEKTEGVRRGSKKR